MDARILNIVAAAMARSNIGMGLPTTDEMRWALKTGEKSKLSDYVTHFCQQFIENDEHWDMFYQEAQGWKKRLEKRTEAEIQATWPDVIKLLGNARKSTTMS